MLEKDEFFPDDDLLSIFNNSNIGLGIVDPNTNQNNNILTNKAPIINRMTTTGTQNRIRNPNNNFDVNDNKFFVKAIKRIYKSCLTKGIELTPEEKMFFKNHKNATRKSKINVDDLNIFTHFHYQKKEMRSPTEAITIKKSEEKYKECSICLENFQLNDSIKLINQCSHIFHKNCIEEWFKFSRKCPVDQEFL
jgi:hypothetical protein